MRKGTHQGKPNYILLFLVVAACLLLLGVTTYFCMPFFRQLSDPDYLQAIRTKLDTFGVAGWLIVLGVQILQIVIAFIPGEPVELLAGILYGAWGGLATCLLGIVLASSIVFSTVRKFGPRFVYRLFGEHKLREFKFLNSTEKLETVTFILFLIPGTPKDMLTYLAGITKIKASRFLVIATFARIPSIITSTTMGATMSRGRWGWTLLVFLLTAAIGLVGILYKQKFMGRLHRRNGISEYD